MSTSSRISLAICALLALAPACTPDDGPVDGGSGGTDATAVDTGIATDTGVHTDATVVVDAGPSDAGPTDLGVRPDADVNADAEVVLDADVPDATIAPDAGADPDAGFANACQNVGGICVSNDAACTSGNGVVLGAGAAGCVFDDGPGACCQPPAPAQEGATCELHGGLCAPISGCNFVDGAFAPPSCNAGPAIICCVPETQCGPETQECCDPSGPTTFRAACDFGTWTCVIPNTQLRPVGMCP